jgi:hypothetical protein
MAPSIHTEVPLEPEVKKTKHTETLVLGPRNAGEVPAKVGSPTRIVREEGSFQSSVLEYNRMARRSRPLDFLISLLINLAILAATVFAGLYFTDTLNLKQLESTFLTAPPPPAASTCRTGRGESNSAAQGIRECRKAGGTHRNPQNDCGDQRGTAAA